MLFYFAAGPARTRRRRQEEWRRRRWWWPRCRRVGHAGDRPGWNQRFCGKLSWIFPKELYYSRNHMLCNLQNNIHTHAGWQPKSTLCLCAFNPNILFKLKYDWWGERTIVTLFTTRNLVSQKVNIRITSKNIWNFRIFFFLSRSS